MAADLTQCLVMVVRYFGGTKLGTGGLIQAYKAAAEQAIQDAGVVQKEWRVALKVQCTYAQFPTLIQFLKQQQAEKVDIVQEDNCKLTYTFNLGQKETVNQWLTDQELYFEWSEIIV
jgi:putative IMPACT (imprinted ancient) family translation regulator